MNTSKHPLADLSHDTLALLREYRLNATGLIHVGANHGQEFEHYKTAQASTVVYVEPIARIYHSLKARVEQEPGHHAIQALCSDRDGIEVTLNVANNDGQSSSLFPLGRHQELYPAVTYQSQESHVTRTLDSVIAQDFPGVPFNVLVIDTQGAELLVLKGATRLLEQLEAIHLEASEMPLYEGGCTWEEIKDFLRMHGFSLKHMYMGAKDWGMMFFMKTSLSAA